MQTRFVLPISDAGCTLGCDIPRDDHAVIFTQSKERDMSDAKSDIGVIGVLIERLQTQRLPRALDLKEKVERGELLDDFDIAFLEQVFADANSVNTIVARHPEYKDLVARVIHLYKEITERALANQKAVG